MAREYRVRKRARDGGDGRTKKEEKKRETEKERKKGKRARGTVRRSKCV